MKIPDDPFGLKVAVGGVVELVKDYLQPIAKAKGETHAELIRIRGKFEARKLENQFHVIECAEENLDELIIEANPIDEDVMKIVLEE